MDADSYKRLKSPTTEQIDKLTIQINELEVADTAFEKYARYGMSLLKDLTWYFQEAEPQARRKLLGSIFPAKLAFQNGNYRTTMLNPELALILQKNKGLGNEKAEDMIISENVSGDVARTGIEPATQGFSELENHFFLLPLIELNQPRWTESIGKSRFFQEILAIPSNRRQC